MPRFKFVTAVIFITPLAWLAACDASTGSGGGVTATTTPDQTASPVQAAPAQDPLAAHDPAPGQPVDPAMADDKPRPIMQAQVILERLGFAPGIVDGKEGLSTRNAIMGFQEARSLPVTGKLDAKTLESLSEWNNIPATRVITIPDDFAKGPFAPLPKEPEQQAQLPAMGYESLDEKLAERFHTTIAVLQELNPALAGPPPAASTKAGVPPRSGSIFAAGQQVRVPNIGADALDLAAVDNPGWGDTLRTLGVSNRQPAASRIVVSKSKGTLRALDGEGKLVALFTVTTGSQHDPLPLGEWKINGKSYNPKFSYDPSLFWDVPDDKGEHLLPPGPNGPVGVVWIDLTKEHYGIHGTPDPETIGRAQSHGCVRLANWDAARLAQMVDGDTKVLFEA